QFAAEFVDFLIRGQGVQPQQAIEKAAARVYQGILATVFGQYPALSQLLGQDVQNGLRDAGALLQSMVTDVANWKQRISQGMGGGNTMGVMGVHSTQPMVSPIGNMTLQQSNMNRPVQSGAFGMLHTPEAPVV